MTEPADLLLWPNTVDAFYADRACSLRSEATRKTWGYTYRKFQRLHPGKPVGGFTTDDLVAFVTQRGWVAPRWSSATARNYRVAMESLFGWAHHAERIPIDPAWRLGQLVRIRRTRVWQPHWLTESQIAALLHTTDRDDLSSQRDRTLLMLGLFAGLRTGELHRLLWHNVHLGAGTLVIIGKGAKPATIVMPPQLHAHLNIWHTTLGLVDGFAPSWPVLPVLAAPNGDRQSLQVRAWVRALSIEVFARSSTATAIKSASRICGRTTCAARSPARSTHGGYRSRTSASCSAMTPSTRPTPTSQTIRFESGNTCAASPSRCEHMRARTEELRLAAG